MATQVFSDAGLERLRTLPDPITSSELIRCSAPVPSDTEFIESHRGAVNRIGIVVHLRTLLWLGFMPGDVPAAGAAHLSDALRIPVGELRGYGAREQTRTDHLREVARFLGWRQLKE